ncbi:hypothetical protein XENTR_v10004052 [Xenopus tropicalis]|nr:hypothetical protein XENTR_v10004052 [Xenopus tropicalis]
MMVTALNASLDMCVNMCLHTVDVCTCIVLILYLLAGMALTDVKSYRIATLLPNYPVVVVVIKSGIPGGLVLFARDRWQLTAISGQTLLPILARLLCDAY